jgi:hypothetical protein
MRTGLVVFVFMILVMAQQVARAAVLAIVNESELPILVGEYDRSVEIDQVRIVC